MLDESLLCAGNCTECPFLKTKYKVGTSIIPVFRLKYLGTGILSTLPKDEWQNRDSNLGS